MNVTDARRASQFWSRALGYAYRDGEFSADDKTHLDLYTDSALEQRTEVERLISLGATAVDWTYPEGARFVVLADTEGNLFCVINAGRD